MTTQPHSKDYTPPPYPVSHVLPAAGILLGQIIAGVLVYPRLPGEIPVHFSGPGQATPTDTTLLSAFGPVLVNAGLALLLAGCARLVLRTVPTDHLAGRSGIPGSVRDALRDAMVNRPADRKDAVRTAKAVLATAWVCGVLTSVICVGVWFPGSVGAAAWFFPAVLVLCAATLLPVVIVVATSGRAR